jgi:hypothetical protein
MEQGDEKRQETSVQGNGDAQREAQRRAAICTFRLVWHGPIFFTLLYDAMQCCNFVASQNHG